MADHQDIMDLAKKGALAKKQERYRELLAEIETNCETAQTATVMLLPGSLDDIKEERLARASANLSRLLPEARQLKKELEKAGLCVF
jgi:hypothetical protein